MTWALVLGGAQCVFADLEKAITQFGEPDVIVGVKDIAIEYPRIDHWATFHLDRIPKELKARRRLGYEDPKAIWTYSAVRVTSDIPIEVRKVKIRGGSSGLLGAIVGMEVASRAVLAGIPLDPEMPHFNMRKRGKPWNEARAYIPHWNIYIPKMLGKVKSMSGYTRQVLGEPTREWIHDLRTPEPSADTLRDTAPSEAAVS